MIFAVAMDALSPIDMPPHAVTPQVCRATPSGRLGQPKTDKGVLKLTSPQSDPPPVVFSPMIGRTAVAKPNYAYEKRQRELAKKQKKEQKEREKADRKTHPLPGGGDGVPVDGAATDGSDAGGGDGGSGGD